MKTSEIIGIIVFVSLVLGVVGVLLWLFVFHKQSSTTPVSAPSVGFTSPVYTSFDGQWIVTDIVNGRPANLHGTFVMVSNNRFKYLDGCTGAVAEDPNNIQQMVLELTCPMLPKPLVLTGTFATRFVMTTPYARTILFARPPAGKPIPNRVCPLTGAIVTGAVCKAVGYDFADSVDTTNSIGMGNLSLTAAMAMVESQQNLSNTNCSTGSCACVTARFYQPTTSSPNGTLQMLPIPVTAAQMAINPNSTLIMQTLPVNMGDNAFLVSESFAADAGLANLTNAIHITGQTPSRGFVKG